MTTTRPTSIACRRRAEGLDAGSRPPPLRATGACLWGMLVWGICLPIGVAPATDLTLERIMGSPALSGPVPRALKLSPDGRLATLLRPRADDRERYDLWAIDTTTGAEIVEPSRSCTPETFAPSTRIRSTLAR